MLHRLSVDNFRSCFGVQLDLDDPVVALVGKNGVGKTNLLHAIDLVCRLCIGAAEWSDLHPVDPDRPASLAIEFSVQGQRFRYSASRKAARFETGHISESLLESTRAGEKRILQREHERLEVVGRDSVGAGKESHAVPAMLQLLPETDSFSKVLWPVVEFLSGVRYYQLGVSANGYEVASPFIMKEDFETWAAFGPPSGVHVDSVAMRLIDLHENREEDFRELMAILGKDGLGLIQSIDVSQVNGSEDGLGAYFLSFIPGGDLAGARRAFPYGSLSAGTRRVVQLLTHMLYDRSAVMLLEQPEDCIHAGLVKKLIDVLQTYADRTQLILSTHSARVVNLLAAEAIRVVTANNGQTAVQGFDEAEVHRITGYLSEDGTLSEYLETL